MHNEKTIDQWMKDFLPGEAGNVSSSLQRAVLMGLSRIVQAFPDEFETTIPVDVCCTGWSSVKDFMRAAHGQYRSHPLAVALARLSIAPADRALDHVVAHFYFACEQASLGKEFHSANYSACLALRCRRRSAIEPFLRAVPVSD